MTGIPLEDADALRREAHDAIAFLYSILSDYPEVLDESLRGAIRGFQAAPLPRARPVEYDGALYTSRAALAAAVGCNIATVHSAIFRRNLKTIMGRRITIDGITYPTKRAASRALGIPYNNLRER